VTRCQSMGITDAEATGLNALVRAAYDLLGLQASESRPLLPLTPLCLPVPSRARKRSNSKRLVLLAKPADVLHDGAAGDPRVDDQEGCQGATGCGRDPPGL
jgi:hypothetical protein